MQLTCSKCKKVYNLDKSKIPPGVASTRCKACGNSIVLRQSAHQAPRTRTAKAVPPPSGAAQAQPCGAEVMQLKCQYCSKKYEINPKSIPQGLASTKCKSCGHTISLKPQAAAPDKADPVKAVPQTAGTKEIICLYCGKKYSIKAAKIPAGVTTTKCKACGRNMSLTPTAGLDFAFKNEISKKAKPQKSAEKSKVQPVPQVPIIQNIESSKSPMWRKPWALAAAAIMVVLCIGLLYSGAKLTGLARETIRAGNIFKKEKESAAERPESLTVARRDTGLEPFLALKINVPLLLEAVDRNLPEDKKDIKYTMAVGIFKSFGLKRLQLYLYPDPEHIFLPVIFAESQKGQSLEKKLTSQGNYVQFLEPVSDGVFRIKKGAVPEGKQKTFPIDRYLIQFEDHIAIIAPQDLFGIFQTGKDPMLNTRVAQMIASISDQRDLAALSVRIPENFSNDWQKQLQGNPALQQNPQAAMAAAIGGGALTRLSEPLKSVESLAIGFRLEGSNGRVLRYAQQFRKGVDGGRVYRQLQSGKQNDLDADGMVLKLIELFNDHRYRHTVGHKNNRLTLELNWKEQHDKAFWAALSEATLGQIFAQSMELMPTTDPIETRYDSQPNLSTNIDINDLKKIIPAAVQRRLFPGNYMEFGDRPRLTLELDTLEVPNAALAQMTYEVLDVVSADGASIMRVEENQFQPIINPGSGSPGYIDINVLPGIPAEALGTAKIRFNIALPSDFIKLHFISGNSIAARESNGVLVMLDRLEKDVAKVTFRGGTSARLFALDRTGRSLAVSESMSSSSSAAARFQGEINTLMVVVVQDVIDYSFEIEADLNRSRQLALSRKP